MARKKEQKTLTVESLMKAIAEYNKKTFIPELKEIFVTKDEFAGLRTDVNGLKVDVADLKTDVSDLKTDVNGLKIDMADIKTDVAGFKNEFKSSKDETITNFDKVFKKLDILLDEKVVREHQEEKQKRLWAIVLRALKDHQILTPKELESIAKLEIF
ncbi:MAG: hypothetical protein COT61_03240 [Candidatus Portnoybacteria bacterium CG09_land_8_20_14_0_10_44_13]|uniref:Uncharacterized protein n=4 Tax=Candidatus Portnoyibacteriota TaxID=1817913 RepID=A0A2H0KPB2_9BACT|nr:MAG: hypothetical protein COV85_04430 [Candidatus Portnoybacteria bacterium CG11_big_fil_rev_8_21_14_0_20_44_10]PIS16573.1 MAG: hypothetical protein COT61_03240 [Candidatus Portnoybacteria bacterium CG09_land_8_20_14_0_10_44_13]PIZ71096.1 MAG: hypothetical protein COY11_01720 [Candidatus Portnoybacteria bacterium CG_4_10_14_0_2_um_filter_44_20]PJA63642.1 MAG: hypothetical protein CO161_00395 [Candidatus Portnoybacteria bacterium CG_4_9_14_3_um_filter_44_9]